MVNSNTWLFLGKQSYVDLYTVILLINNYRTAHMNLMVTLEFKVTHCRSSTQTPMAPKGEVHPDYVEL